MRLNDIRSSIGRFRVAGLALLLAIAFTVPSFAAVDSQSELPEDVLCSGEEDTDRLEIELDDDSAVDRKVEERMASARSARLRATISTKIDSRHRRRTIPRAPPRV